MKKLNQMTIETKNAKSYFVANDILNLAFNFLDKDKGYTTRTIDGDIDTLKLTVNISFTEHSEAYKLKEVLELFETLDLFADAEEDSDED